MQLVLNNNSIANPLTLDLTNYIDVQKGDGMDTASPSYSDKQFTHALLKEGGVYTYEHANMKEIIFPLLLTSTTSSGAATLVQMINNLINTPGAVAQWQDDGMSKASYYPLLSGILDVDYSFREQSTAHFTRCKLRLFSQPFITPSAPRFYAAASATGPLLMISPFASNGTLTIAASTQAGVAGFGGQQQGPSSGVFYGGNPSLAGDAPAILQISYAAPLPLNSTGASLVGPPGQTPYVAVSILPDQNYNPLITASQLATDRGVSPYRTGSTAIASSYITSVTAAGPAGMKFYWYPFGTGPLGSAPGVLYAGNHRVFAIARASGGTAYFQTITGPLVKTTAVATISGTTDWQLVDLGTITVTASQAPRVPVFHSIVGAAANVDVTGLVVLPDSTTWFLNPNQISPSQYGIPALVASAALATYPLPPAAYGNTILIDDTVVGQFIYNNATSVGFTPSPAVMGGSSMPITPFTRGVFPRPDPFRSIPIIAILGVNQPVIPSFFGGNITTASSANSQLLPSYAQVNVLERARYVLP